LITRTRRI